MMRRLVACVRAWLMQQFRNRRLRRALDAIEFETGIRPNTYWPGAGFPAVGGLPRYKPKEEHPMPKKRSKKRKPVKRAKPAHNAKGKVKRRRSAVDGRLVSKDFADKHPRTTVAERK